MISLIYNEYKKIGFLKHIILILFMICILLLLKYYNKIGDNTIYTIIPLLNIVNIINNSGIIINEYNNGTFKYYLTKPIKRYKIYLSKFIYLIIYNVINILLIYIIFIFFNIKLDTLNILKNTIPIILTNTIILYFSTLIKNNSLIIGLCIFLVSFGLIITQFCLGIDFKLVIYTIFPYMDLSIFNDIDNILLLNKEFNINLRINLAILIDILYSILFFILGLTNFIKKDINY